MGRRPAKDVINLTQRGSYFCPSRCACRTDRNSFLISVTVMYFGPGGFPLGKQTLAGWRAAPATDATGNLAHCPGHQHEQRVRTHVLFLLAEQ